MLSFIRHIIYLLIPALCLVLGSCSARQEEQPINPAESSREALFTITLSDGNSTVSRSTPTDGEYDQGSGLENRIDFEGSDYRIYLISKSNVMVSELYASKMFWIDTDENGRSYSITATLRPFEIEAITNGCKIAVLANWGVYPDVNPGTTDIIRKLCSSEAALLNYTSNMTLLSEDNLIPMYGIRSFEAGSIELDNNTYRVGTIRMLRALAKIEVKPEFVDYSEGEDPRIESISLTNCYTTAVKMQGAEYAEDESGYVHGSWAADYTPVNIPSNAGTIKLPFLKDDETGSYIAYVPEYDNLDGENLRPEAERARIEVTFLTNGYGSKSIKGYLDFHDSESYIDIARNNWYRFNTKIKGEKIECTVDVIPFSAVDLQPSYGLWREPLSGYTKILKEDGTLDYWQDKWGTKWYLGKSEHEVYTVINGEKCLLVYNNPDRIVNQNTSHLDHWFDKDGNKHSFEANEITSNKYYPVHLHSPYWPDYYINDKGQKVWITPFRDDAWNWSPYFAQYVWDLDKYSQYMWWGEPYKVNTPDYWYDFRGNRHEMSETEESFIASWQWIDVN